MYGPRPWTDMGEAFNTTVSIYFLNTILTKAVFVRVLTVISNKHIPLMESGIQLYTVLKPDGQRLLSNTQ